MAIIQPTGRADALYSRGHTAPAKFRRPLDRGRGWDSPAAPRACGEEVLRNVNLEKIYKRDGRLVDFDAEKIAQAIFKAAVAVGGSDYDLARRLAAQVVEELRQAPGSDYPTVEQVQNVVEKVLIENGHARTAKAYILYREKRAIARDARQLLRQAHQLVDEYLERADWRVSENSNMSYSLQGLNQHVSSAVVARYWLNAIYPHEVKDAHVNGDFHIHDLGVLGPYCCGWDLYDLLLRGFGGVPGKVESRPPKHLRTALGQVVNFFYTLQGEAAGAQAFSNFDTLLAPFVRADGLTYEEVKQCIQEFVFNLNVPTRVGFQTPFTNLTFDLTPSPLLANEAVIIGGEPQNTTYGDYQREMYMLNRAFAEIMLEGDARGRVFTFPIPTYNITPDFDWDNPMFDAIWEMTAKYGIPYFANFINSDMKPEDARSMCCRLRLDNRELRRRGGGLFGASPLTGSLGVVTINLPRLGYLSSSEDELLERLDHLMRIAAKSLEIKRKVLERLTEQGLYPYSAHYLEPVKARFGAYWANHFNTIGIVGMNELCLNFLGTDIASPEGRDLALSILRFARERLADLQQESGQLFNLEATPAESAAYRLARIDAQRYPGIIASGTVDRPYYTNSTHLPPHYNRDIFEVLEHQDELQCQYTGGTVLHIFLGERLTDGRQAKVLVRRIAENYHLPYFTLTPTFSVCPVHGYLAGEWHVCPHEHTPQEIARYGIETHPLTGATLPRRGVGCEVYSRIVGYLRPVAQWNEGKQAEYLQRHKLSPQELEAIASRG
ncbi:MAG: ribonucleoside triphosphate reductase [Armatimonadetes bacterium]|nr:ribonucleoside triphosphate reductase [Armatimonadota bacterium]